MSGGTFDYKEFHIGQIADDIELELNRQGKERERGDLWYDKEHYEKYPDEKFYVVYPKEIQGEFKKAVRALRIAAAYAHCIDYYMAGDTGEESFLKHLKEELKKIKK